MFSEILHVPDLWIFRALKIRPQIGFCPQIGCPQIGWCTVFHTKVPDEESVLLGLLKALFFQILLHLATVLRGEKIRLRMIFSEDVSIVVSGFSVFFCYQNFKIFCCFQVTFFMKIHYLEPKTDCCWYDWRTLLPQASDNLLEFSCSIKKN